MGEGFLGRSENHRQRPHELARSLDPRVRVPRVIRVASSRTPTATVPNNVRPVRQDGKASYYHTESTWSREREGPLFGAMTWTRISMAALRQSA